MRWVILTGEYPPQPGGVSDYTRQVARALAAAGDAVHVFAPAVMPGANGEDAADDAGVALVRLPGHYGPAALAFLDRYLSRLPRPYRLLVQYVPHAFGFKGMNVGFGLWLRSRRRERMSVMFHEVAFYANGLRPVRHLLLQTATQFMARLAADSAERIYLSIPGWEPYLRALSRKLPLMTWLPVPSNIPTQVDNGTAAEIRSRFAPDLSAPLIGTFGTFAASIVELLQPVLAGLLQRDARRVALLVGRGSDTLAARMLRSAPELKRRLFSASGLPGDRAAAHLAACDLLVQPFPDGVCGRRTSAMAGLALGRAVVTNAGRFTESIWRERQCVALTADGDPADMIRTAETLLDRTELRSALGARAARTYQDCFAIERCVQRLRLGLN